MEEVPNWNEVGHWDEVCEPNPVKELRETFWKILRTIEGKSHTPNCIYVIGEEIWFCHKECPLHKPAKYIGR